MGDKPFRVLLDLTDLHTKCLKYVWMNVSPHELKTIADFKESVIHKLNLEKVEITLYVRNGLLLDDETVMVLREDDTVKIHYQSQHQSIYNVENNVKESRKSGRKRNHSETESNLSLNAKKWKTRSKCSTQDNEIIDLVEITDEKRRKHRQSSTEHFETFYNQSKAFEQSNFDTKNFHKKHKKQTTSEKNITELNFLQKNDSFFSIDNENNTVEGSENKTLKTNTNIRSDKCSKFDSAKESLPINDFSLKEEYGLNKLVDINTVSRNGKLDNNCPKKKRKRRKKRKQVMETIVLDTTGNTEENIQFQSFTTEVHESVPRKHIRYSSSPSKNEENILLECDGNNERVKNITLDASVMSENVSIAPVKPCNNNCPKMSTPAVSDSCKNPNWSLPPLIQKMDINSHNNETGGSKKGKHKNCVYSKSVNDQTFSFDNTNRNKNTPEVCYANLPSLNSRPDIGAHIAYKILELDEHYSPVISDYREGVVKSINLDNEEIEIEYLKHEIKPGRTGKFENLKEDEAPLPEIKTCDIVRWSAVIEPKLING